MHIYNYPSKQATQKVGQISQRSFNFCKEDIETVESILHAVKTKGDQALINYTRKFDAPNLTIDAVKVAQNEIDQAVKTADHTFMKSLERAILQIESFHQQQMPKSWIDTRRRGTYLGQMINPVDAAGIYVPGAKSGKTPLVSTVLMGAIPAKIAGVKRIAVITPPTTDGKVNPYILAAAEAVGIQSIYKAGSAWGIAALAYGTKTIPKVDVIVGPGNIYVTLAKKLVAGIVGIDMLAGPSEILVLADDTANPEYVAADLLSQAEHDPLASSILVTTSKTLAQSVLEVLENQLKKLTRKEIARKSLDDFGAIFCVEDINAALEFANQLAPEHLELCVKYPFELVGRIRNAGAVFMGNYTPEPMGDYIAGPNHILPTAGTARFSSALSVEHFIKKTSLMYYSKSAFQDEAAHVIRLADIEGLGAHAKAIRIRLKSN
jgi:histidinol dehydrogenase